MKQKLLLFLLALITSLSLGAHISFLSNESIEAQMEAVYDNLSGATVSDPKDATSYILNPCFDDGTSAGWSGTAPNMNGDGNHAAALVAEHFNKTFNTYQNLTGLPNGIYRLSAKTLFRGTYDDLLTGANKVAYLYVANGESLRTFFNNAYSPLNTEPFVGFIGPTTEFNTPNVENSVTAADGTVYYIPENPSTFRLYCEAGYYDTDLYFEVTDGKMTIGVKKDQNVSGSTTDWAVFDTFALTYYGSAADAYAYWVEQVKANATDYSDNLVSTWALNDYNNVVNSISFSNNAQAAAAMKAIEEAEAVIAENATLWLRWKKKVDEATNFMSDEKYEAYIPYDMEQYINFDAEDIEDEKSLTNEELLAEIGKIDTWMKETKEAVAAVLQPGQDVTYLLTNPDFTGNANGWTRVAASGGKVAWGSNCYEAWNNSNFDIYQEVNDAPVGVYSISVQGFYRYGRGTPAWDAWNEQESQYVKSSPCFVYMNDFQAPIMNVFAEAITDNSIFTDNDGYDSFDGYYAPNNMATATDCFAADSELYPEEKMFTQKALGLISNVGDILRVGVKGSSNQLDDSWVVFDNFKLTYMGNDLPAIKAVLDPIIYEAKSLDGWMGKSVYAALQQAIANAENPANTDAALAALKDIVTAVENAKASMAKFDELRKALEALNDLINSGNINGNVKAEAQAFITDTRDDADDHIYEDSDIPELLAQIAEFSTIPYTYTEFDEATGTLTYYYDSQMSSRTGITEVYDPINNPDAARFTGYNKKVIKAVIDPSMKNAPLTSMREMFSGGMNPETWVMQSLSKMESIEGLENLNTENVTDMCNMFSSCQSLKKLDLSTFNTSKVTKMVAMFQLCEKLEIVDVSSFNISKVTDLGQMFNYCSSLKTICCSAYWSNTTATSDFMFSNCTSLVGGKGTMFDKNFSDATYARPDGGIANPGYFTEDTMTGIESIHNSQFIIHNEEEAAIYNLAGQKIVNDKWSNGKLPRGIYIKDGKKILR